MINIYDILTKYTIRYGTMTPCDVVFQLSDFPVIGENVDFDSAPLGASLIVGGSVLYIRAYQTIPASPNDWIRFGDVTTVVEVVEGDTTNYDIIMATIDFDVLYNTQLNASAC